MPTHAAGQDQREEQLSRSSGSVNTAVQGQLGGSFGRASVDAYYARKYNAISGSALTPAQLAGLAPQFSSSNSVAATVSDNTSYALMGLYDFHAVKLYGGYERIRCANPETPLTPGFVGIGGCSHQGDLANSAQCCLARRPRYSWRFAPQS